MNDSGMLQMTKFKIRRMFDDMPVDVGVCYDSEDVEMEITMKFTVTEKNLMKLEDSLGCMRSDMEELVR